MDRRFSSVLLVDDDSITNFLNENLLQEMDFADLVHVAIDGFAALKYIRENWIDRHQEGRKLILLDINMPLMNGFEFLEHFEKLSLNDVNVVLLTTSSNDKDLQRAEKFDVKEYIIKPLTENKVAALTEKIKNEVGF